jgi:hypothetical protein
LKVYLDDLNARAQLQKLARGSSEYL